MIWRRLRASLRRNGLGGTLRMAPGRAAAAVVSAWDRTFDARHGTATAGVVELDTLDIDSGNLERGVRYEPTPGRPLARVLAAVPLPRDGGFVDYGCGKGRAMIVAASLGFRRVTGVDFSETLCAGARANLRRYRERTGWSGECRVVCLDAAAFRPAPRDDVFYFFNPFDGAVLERVLGRIADSLAEAPRPAWLVYYYPVWRTVIERSRLFEPFAEFSFGGRAFAVYRHVPESA